MELSFFYLSKIIWIFLSPDLLLVFIVVCACFLLWFKAYKKAIILLNFITAFMILVTITPVGEWLIYPLEKRFSAPENISEPIDGIIMLGGAENIIKTFGWNQAELNSSAERYLAFIHLIKKYPAAKKVYAGGTGSITHQEFKGRSVAQMLFESQGIDTAEIIFESESRNTFENAVFSKRLLNPLPGEKWILVTSACHMPRSYGVFSKAGWHIIPYPVDHQSDRENLFRMNLNFSGNLNLIKSVLHEWTGLAAYYFTGKTDTFFPKGKN